MPAKISSRTSRESPRPERWFAGKRVVVMGLGRFGGGIGVARWLNHLGAHVRVTDQADRSTLKQSIDALADCDIDFRLGRHHNDDLDDADLLIISPAVNKNRSAFVRTALDRDIPWTTEINLFIERCPARIIGVTGTAGKSTTSAMLDTILQRTAHGQTYLGGNIGRSLLGDLHRMTPRDTVILELSSFQLEDLPSIERRPDIAVYVSLWPNHLERHGTFEAYRHAKLNMIRDATSETLLVLGVPDRTQADAIRTIAKSRRLRVISPDDDHQTYNLKVPGPHNAHNAACAAAVARFLGASDETIRTSLESFKGLPNRLQFVASIDDIDYYNDSKATSIEATVTALRAFDRPVIAIIGGQRRDATCDSLVTILRDTARAVVCFGPAGTDVFDAIKTNDNCPQPFCVDTLRSAVFTARDLATPGDIVLLSPGFPSYDAFPNYEHRGHAFTKFVQERR